MNDVLVIEVGADATTIVRAGIVGSEIRWLSDVSEEAICREQVESAVIVLNGACVATHRVAVPNFADNKLLKILPGIMDEKIATFGDAKHFAVIGERQEEDGTRIVAVVDTRVMDGMQVLAKACNVSLQSVVPDYLLLDSGLENMLAKACGGRVLALASDGTGFTAEEEQANLMLSGDAEINPIGETEWRAFLGSAVDATENLLQGAYAPRGNLLESLRWMKRSAVLAVAAAFVWAGGLLLDAGANNDQADALYGDAEQVFREALPNVSRIVNMDAQMRQAVADARQQGGGEFFVLSDLIFKGVQQQSQTMLETMRYDAEEGVVALNVSFPSFAESEEFKQVLQQLGARVAEGSSRQEGSRVFSELTVGRAE